MYLRNLRSTSKLENFPRRSADGSWEKGIFFLIIEEEVGGYPDKLFFLRLTGEGGIYKFP